MVEFVGDRLPKWSEEEVKLIKGTYDYIGLNHYTTSFAKRTFVQGKDYSDDAQLSTSPYDINNSLIGPFAESQWLNVYPTGFKKLLKWVNDRYTPTHIYVFENGVSVPKETELPLEEALQDTFRLNYYHMYIQAMEEAIAEDKVPVKGYFAWSLMDNFEWADGYSTRFGMVYVDYANHQTRHIKNSGYWYANHIKSKSQREQQMIQ